MAVFDPISVGLAGIGTIGSLYSGIQGGREQRRARLFEDEERQRRGAIRDSIMGLVRPQIESDISGQEITSNRLAREQQELRGRAQFGASQDAQRQALIDSIARLGGATGRRSSDILAPAAQGRLERFDTTRSQGLSDMAIQIASQNAQRREAQRQSALGRAFQLGEFGSSGYMPYQPSNEYDQLGEASGGLLSLGVSDILRQRRERSSIPEYTTGSVPNSVRAPQVGTSASYDRTLVGFRTPYSRHGRSPIPKIGEF